MESKSDPKVSPPKRSLEERAAQAAGFLEVLRAEVGKVYVGSAGTIRTLMTALVAGGHVLLEGVPGLAKTTLVKGVAQALACDYSRIQFTPDLMPADITGTMVLDLQRNEFVLHRGPLFSNVVLIDEVNRAPAKTQSALLEAMQEGQITIEGRTETLIAPFWVLATQNPIDHQGVYSLPEAQMDRFLFRIQLTYPDSATELEFLQLYNSQRPTVEPVLTKQQVIEMQAAAQEVFVDPELMNFIVRLMNATRTHPQLALGASPRASLGLMRASQACALLNGRAFVTPEDIRWAAPYVLEHRLLLNPDAELDGYSVRSVVSACLAKTPFSVA